MCEQKEECWGEHSALRDADIYSYSEGCGTACALSVIIEHKSATGEMMEKSSAARHFNEAGHSFSTLSFCVIKFLEVAEVVTLNRNVTIRKNIFFLENALFFLMKNYPSRFL